jgi:non-ribosomal peptide synthetase-like protein
VQLLNVLILGPIVLTALLLLARQIPQLTQLVGSGPLAATTGVFYLEVLVVSAALFFGSLLLGLIFVVTVPKLLSCLLVPGRVYRLYGIHCWLHRTVVGMTNAAFYNNLFGDSSYVLRFLAALGYRLGLGGQTGSNFGAAFKHDSPYVVNLGTGAIVSDGMSFVSADYSNTSFRISPLSVGANTFFGNRITYPSAGRIGDGCLVATKAMIPIDGPVRNGIGLLGSPSFEIPLPNERDSRLELNRGDLRRQLTAKNRHNLHTMGIYLAVQWFRTYVSMLIGLAALDLYDRLDMAALAIGLIAIAVLNFGHSVLAERAATGFRAMQPQHCSIYEPYFWWHERYWKLSIQPSIFDGTPLKSLTWRMLGVRIGRRVFDDGCAISEKTLVTIGDDCTLGAGVVLQSHSMENGVFKSDRIRIGDGCTLGSNAFVHYGTTLGNGATLGTDAFLMKGTQVPPGARWHGNPARNGTSS